MIGAKENFLRIKKYYRIANNLCGLTMTSKNKSQYASLPNLSNQDFICQQMKTRTAISNTNINSFALQREHGVSLYKDHASNIFNEKIQEYSNTKDTDLTICKRSCNQLYRLGAKPRSQCRDSMNVSLKIRKKESTKDHSTAPNPFFKTHRTINVMESCLRQPTKNLGSCNGGKGRINRSITASKSNF